MHNILTFNLFYILCFKKIFILEFYYILKYRKLRIDKDSECIIIEMKKIFADHEIQSISQGYSEDTHKKYVIFKIHIYICIYLIMNNT